VSSPPPDRARLLYVVNHAGFFLSHRLQLALAARDAGWDVAVATPASKHAPAIAAAGLTWFPVRLTRSGVNPFAELRTLADLVRLYRRVRPDVVHHVTTKPVLYGTLAARFTRVPAVVDALTGLGHVFIAEDLRHRLLRRAILGAYRLSLRHRNMRVIFQNDHDRRIFTSAGTLRDEDTVLVRGSGVDAAAFQPRTPEERIPTVVFPARMLFTKGVREMLAAAEMLRKDGVKARFILVGESDPDNPASLQDDELREWERRGIVEYWGRRNDMPAVYAEADVVCLPSYREGMPKSLLEAAACGLPAVTTDVPGCRDVVVEGETGFIVPHGDAAALAAALRKLIGDASLRQRLGGNARRHFLEHFQLSRVIGETLRIYDQLLDRADATRAGDGRQRLRRPASPGGASS
jgi:glycosyltransferase involved in cell wall biosynthesis